MKKIENLKEIVPRLFALVVAATLLACCAVLFMGKSGFGWLSQNQTTQGGGTQISLMPDTIKAEYMKATDTQYQPLSDSGDVDMAEMDAPGKSAVIKVKLTNLSQKAVAISEFGIFAPTAEEETPKTVDGTDYYLSTQITARVEKVEINGQESTTTLREPAYLGQMVGVEFHAGTINLLGESIALSIGGYCELTIRFTFVNSAESQNQYKGFSKGDGQEKCTRKFYISAS